MSLLALMLTAPASAQEPPTPAPILLRLEGWKEPVRIQRVEANQIIFTAFVKYGFGGWIPLATGPEFAAFRGDSIGLAPPDPRADMVSIDLTDGPDGELIGHMRLARMRPVWDGGFEPDIDLTDTPEAKAIFGEIEAGLLAAKRK
ncbi:MAG: hypothetical protein QM773_16710 [Hyphomonadaceae bacterium]